MDYCPNCNRLKLLSDGECKYCTGPWRSEKQKQTNTCQTCGKFCRGKQCYDCFVNRWGERKKPILSAEAIELKKKVNEKRNLRRKEQREQERKLKELADLVKRQEEKRLKRRLEYQKRKDESNNQSRRRLNKELKTTRKTPRSRSITQGVSKKQESQSLTR